jgi:hypothetical protein
MPIIRHFDAAEGTSPVFFKEVDNGTCLLDFLIANFEPNFGGLSASIYVNGSILYDTKDGGSGEELDLKSDFILEPVDRIDIITHQGVESIIYYAIVAIAAAVAAIALAPSVNPGNAESQGSSPNSKLNAATNEFRPNRALAEVFGSPVSYPDFIQLSWYVYENNLKVQREMFCVGVSAYDITKVRSGETLLESIPNSSYTIYGPNIIPPPEQRIIVRETNEITSQSMEAPNAESIAGTFDGGDDVISSTTGESTIIIGESNIENMVVSVGAYLRVKITEKVIASGIPSYTVVLDGFWQVTEMVGTNSVKMATGSTYSSTAGSTSVVDTEITDSSGEQPTWVGWYSVNGSAVEEVWFHIAMPRGLRTQEGGQLRINFTMEIRQVDEDGNPIAMGYTDTLDESVVDSTLDPQFRTYYFKGLPLGRYQGRVKRTSNERNDASSEAIELEQLVSVEYQKDPNYGNVTLLWVERKASERIVGGSSSKINLDLTRKLPYFNRSTGLLEIDNLVDTRDFADAVAYTLIVAGKRDPSLIDLAGLYAINDSLPPELRTFDFTFDDKDVSMGERVKTICDVARVVPFRAYQDWFFERDQKKPFPVALYNRRNISKNSSPKQVFKQFLPSDKDSVSLTYVSLPDNVERTVYRSIKSGAISNTVGTYPKEIKLPGCQSIEQANNRIDVEFRKVLYSKRTAEVEILHDGFAGKITDRVRFADINDAEIFDGEVLDIFGDEYLTSESFSPVAGKSYFVQITNDDGELTNLVQCLPLSYTSKGFKAVGLNGGYTADGNIIQLGSRYIIATDGDYKETDYIITDIQTSDDRTMTVSLAAYNDKIYEMDN